MLFKRREKTLGQLETLIGATVRVVGDVEFSGGLHLDGRIAGNVRGSGQDEARLSVSESGVVEGSVTVSTVELHGAVRGDIVAPGRVVLGARARVEGNLSYGDIEMASGARIIGKLTRLGGPVSTSAVEST
jgi:cytoskeletal protein CcmA (bactofilin family)